MKSTFIFISLLMSISGCGQRQDVVKGATIIGSWKLIEVVTIGPPVAGHVSKIENGKTIRFDADSTFIDSSFDCEGVFFEDASEIELTIPCSPVETISRCKFSLESSERLNLTKIPHECDEGCYYVFKRL